MPKIAAVPGFRFKEPLSVSIEHEGEGAGYWLARIAVLDLWADGETEEEALRELQSSLTQLAADLYDAPLATLGPRPQRWQAYLRQVAVKTS
jgi:predicted RNase H-like HicB family nuclease